MKKLIFIALVLSFAVSTQAAYLTWGSEITNANSSAPWGNFLTNTNGLK